MVNSTKEKGDYAERQARHYLEKRGLKTLQCNYHCRYGEIDLIMEDKNELVFVEVRSRTPKGYGNAVETISDSKIRKIIITAEQYLQDKKISPQKFCRFDIVSIDNTANKSMIKWLPNAFQAGS